MLVGVSYVPGLSFNLYSLNAIQRNSLIISGASDAQIVGTNVTFPRNSSGSYLRETQLAKRRTVDMNANNILQP